MTAPRAFGPGELEGAEDLQADDVAAETRIARDLEAMTSQAAALPSPDFTDRVMLAIDLEPVPAPARAAGVALRRGALGAFLAAFSDAWRVATRSGFPRAVRAQALALVLVVGALAAGSGVAAAGAVGLIRDDQGLPSPAPSLEAPTPVGPSPIPSMATPSVEPPTTEPPSLAATDELPTVQPARTVRPTDSGDNHGGGGGGGSGSGGGGDGGDGPDHGGKRTPRPTSDSGGGGEDESDDSGSGSSGSGGGGDDSSGPGGSGTDDGGE
jgi:hypothetical protein